MKVVDWQTKKFNRFKWIAIIKKNNKFVYKLNKYLKFKEINFKKNIKISLELKTKINIIYSKSEKFLLHNYSI